MEKGFYQKSHTDYTHSYRVYSFNGVKVNDHPRKNGDPPESTTLLVRLEDYVEMPTFYIVLSWDVIYSKVF